MHKANGVFRLIDGKSYGQEKKCFCIGADNCSDVSCNLVKERLDLLEVEFKKDNINSKDQKYVDSILKEFDVETEEELVEKINEDALTIPCYECGVEIGLDDLNWDDGEPFCATHYFEDEEDFYD